MPGDGAGTAQAALEAFSRLGIDVPINLEVFSDELRQLVPADAATALAAKVRDLLGVESGCAT
jgi:hypothetical protein